MPPKKTDSKKPDALQKIEKMGTAAASQAAHAAATEIQDVGKKSLEVGQKALSAVGGEMKGAGKKAFSAVSDEVVEFEKKIVQLPVNRILMLILGLVVIVAAFLGSFGKALLVLIGLFLLVAGYLGTDIFVRFLEKDTKKK